MRCLRKLGLMIGMLAVIGCAAPRAAVTPEGYPGDFSLTLLVDDERGKRLFLVEPNRTLRAATGDGVHRELYPPRTAKLTHAQMAALWRAVASERGPAQRPGRQVRIERHEPRGRVESPLVAMLSQWAGLR